MTFEEWWEVNWKKCRGWKYKKTANKAYEAGFFCGVKSIYSGWTYQPCKECGSTDIQPIDFNRRIGCRTCDNKTKDHEFLCDARQEWNETNKK